MILVRFRKVLPLRQSEWMLALVLVAIGLVYALSPGLFERRYFATMARVMPQDAWATWTLIVGGARLTFLWINGAWRASPHMRAVGAFLACFVWVQLSLAAAANDHVGQTTVIWPIFFLFDAYSAYVAATEARVSDERARAKRTETTDDRTGV